jgi:hypothetical protein
MHIHRGGAAGIKQARFVAVDGFVGLLDTYPDAAVAYSFRKLRNAYAGSAIRLRRSDNDAEADIGFDANGAFDTAAAATHLGGNTGFIVTWYDQSGNGLDVTQATEANQPSYVASGIGGLPCADCPGVTNSLLRSSVPSTVFGAGTSFSLLFVHAPETSSGSCVFHWEVASTNRILVLPNLSNDYRIDFGNDTNNAGGGLLTGGAPPTDGSEHIVEMYRDSGDTQAILDNGSAIVSATRAADLSSATGNMGFCADAAGTGSYDGRVSELVLWQADLGTTDRTGARDNMNSYYTVF